MQKEEKILASLEKISTDQSATQNNNNDKQDEHISDDDSTCEENSDLELK